MSEDRVYQTRLVHRRSGLHDSARNVFADPTEAKEYLEGYVRIRHDAEPGEWHEERSADEKWRMSPDGFNGRAVVMGVPLRKDDESLLEKTKEIAVQLEADRHA